MQVKRIQCTDKFKPVLLHNPCHVTREDQKSDNKDQQDGFTPDV
jgi:hypothetical protein